MEEIRVGDWVKVVSEEGRLFGPAKVLAIDPECKDTRGAAWIRFEPSSEEGYYSYRSIDLVDLEPLTNEGTG